ncbi:MAG: sulfotransferase family 2 domain-containing protein [Candidatus Latescibacterota bacterium]|nr:sulfotransferase family 2 domain-containing protein [Candidatus Latescibacterota bacterium]
MNQEQLENKAKLFFVHVPKTGGRWFDKTMANFMENEDRFFPPIESYMQLGVSAGDFLQSLHNRYGWHMSMHQSINAGFDSFHDYLTVSICRNPFDMLVSMYYHHSMDAVNQRYIKRKGPSGWGSANIAHNITSFSEFIKRFCDPSVPWVHPELRKFLFHQMYNPDGTCGVNVLLRYEQLNLATALMLRHLHKDNVARGLKSEYSDADFDKIVNSKKVNTSKKRRKKDYRAYYTDELRELVEHACSAELRLFGYTFDGSAIGEDPILLPENTFYSPTYPISLAGFTVEEQRIFSTIIGRASMDLQLKLDDLTSLVEVGVKIRLRDDEAAVLFTPSHWKYPNIAMIALEAMGYRVVVSNHDIETNMLGKINSEWLPLDDSARTYYSDMLAAGNDQTTRSDNNFIVQVSHGRGLVPENRQQLLNSFKSYIAEYEDQKRKYELNARLKDMGIDIQDTRTLQKEQ